MYWIAGFLGMVFTAFFNKRGNVNLDNKTCEVRRNIVEHVLHRYTLLTSEEINTILSHLQKTLRFSFTMNLVEIKSLDIQELNVEVSRLAYLIKPITVAKFDGPVMVNKPDGPSEFCADQLDAMLVKLCHTALFDSKDKITLRFNFHGNMVHISQWPSQGVVETHLVYPHQVNQKIEQVSGIYS